MLIKKAFKLLTVVLILIAAGFGLYLYKLHALAVEGNNLFEQRCLKVNPQLISYKNSFLGFANCLNTQNCVDKDILVYYDGYMNGMRKYVKEESQWLDMQKKFISRWDFRLFQPWYIKQAGEYQWKMYEGYRDDAQFQLDIVDKRIAPDQLKSEISEPRQRRDKYSQLYGDFYAKASAINDWRKIFGSIPLPKGCTSENITIPDTSGSINWDGNSSPTPYPVDPDKTS